MARTLPKPFPPYGVATKVTPSAVTYHQTTVVERTPDHLTIRTGGYRTATTLSRIRDGLVFMGNPAALLTHDGEWYIVTRAGAWRMDHSTLEIDRTTHKPRPELQGQYTPVDLSSDPKRQTLANGLSHVPPRIREHFRHWRDRLTPNLAC